MSGKGGRARWSGPTAAFIGVALVLWAWWLDRPPAPLPADAPPQRFSAARARDDLEHIAVRPHMTGSAEHARVRAWLLDELRSLGFETEVQEATVVERRGRVQRAATVRNILARKRGTASTGGVTIASHYDTQQLTPGAGDDGSGVSATLEALRALQAGEPLRNDLFVLITDAEELGLLGARPVLDHPWWQDVTVLLNFEARGSSGASVMIETNDRNGWIVRELARADPYPAGSSLYWEVYRAMPNGTDFAVFKRGGIAGLNFALAEGADVYHRPTDTIDNLSPASLQHQGEHALALLRHFGDLDLGPSKLAPNVVFFRLPLVGLVSYPYSWAGPLTLLVLLFAAFVIERGFGRRRLTAGGMLAGAAMGIVALLAAAAGGALLWRIVAPMHQELGSVAGRSLYEEGWYGLAVACIAVAVIAGLLGALRRWIGIESLTAGVLLLPLGAAVATWWYLTGVSMLFLWPALFLTEALRQLLARPPEETHDGAHLVLFGVLGAPVVLLLFPLVWALYIGLSISAAPLIGAAAALLVLLLLPLLELAGRPNRVWLPAVACGLALAFGVAGVGDARPGPTRPRPTDLLYALDRDAGTALWATRTPAGDRWIERFVGDDSRLGDLDAFRVAAPDPYRLAPAPLVDTLPAAIRVIADDIEEGVRRLRLEIESAVAPELTEVFPVSGGDARLLAVNGVPVDAPGGAARGAWLLQHFGQPPAGVLTVDVETPTLDGPVELVLVESLMRLPPVAGLDTERPPGWTPNVRRPTDMTLFRQRIVLP